MWALLYQRARSMRYKQITASWQRQIPAASALSFPSVTSIAESLSLTQNHSGCWRYSMCYESACDLVIGLLDCNKYQ